MGVAPWRHSHKTYYNNIRVTIINRGENIVCRGIVEPLLNRNLVNTD
jgi:hypothetical protein